MFCYGHTVCLFIIGDVQKEDWGVGWRTKPLDSMASNPATVAIPAVPTSAKNKLKMEDGHIGAVLGELWNVSFYWLHLQFLRKKNKTASF